MVTLVANSQADPKQWAHDQLLWCATRIEKMAARFKTAYPSASTTHMAYRIKANDDWTNGFWTAMLLIAQHVAPSASLDQALSGQLDSFQKRLEAHTILDHHDIGFLYSLSAYALYSETQDAAAAQLVIDAAKVLSQRFQPKGQFIQAWGQLGDPAEYRLIIDSLLNLPLLFEASRLSGDPHFATIARAHYQTLIAHIIRPDDSTYHTFYFDPKTGAPLYGATHQGFSDESCWARGQAWILLGMPLYKRFDPEADTPDLYHRLLHYYQQHLPEDGIPYWDLSFTAADDQPRDSSAAAIVACGLIEAENQGYLTDGKAQALRILHMLSNAYRTATTQEGLLQHGVYAFAEGKGIDEANLWGDYFYMEALRRIAEPAWPTYW